VILLVERRQLVERRAVVVRGLVDRLLLEPLGLDLRQGRAALLQRPRGERLGAR